MSGDTETQDAGLAAKAIVLLFAVPFVATLFLALASFPLGLYTTFFTTLTRGTNASSPVPFYLWLGPFPVFLPFSLPFGVLFASMIAAYVVMFAISAIRGSTLGKAFSRGLQEGVAGLLSSDLVVAIVSIGFLAFTSTAIDTLTQAAGGQIGSLQGNDASIFIATATAPLVEEFGFRLCIIGLVALVLSIGMGWKRSLGALWRPASVYEGEDIRTGKVFTLFVALAGSSIIFGLAHVTSGSGWELGKLPEAIFGGLVLGYVYMRYGFHIAVLTHWGIDYLGTVFSFFGEGAFGIPWGSEPGYFLQQDVTFDLIAGIGLFSFLLVVYLGIKKLRRLASSGTVTRLSS